MDISKITSLLGGWQGYAAAALTGAVLVGGAAVVVQGWRYGSQIAELQRDQQQARADSNAAALTSLQGNLLSISEAATRAAAVAPQLTAQVGALSKALKNANPLPAGCHPDDVRVRALTDSVRAANRAAAGQSIGGAVPVDPGSTAGASQLR